MVAFSWASAGCSAYWVYVFEDEQVAVPNPMRDGDESSPRVARGGAWAHPAGEARAAKRSSNLARFRFDAIGVRPARSVR